jgi:hypothetical protein
MKARFVGLMRRIMGRGSDAEDEEKEAMLRHIGEDVDSDAESTTMEQDIAQFRTAASVVGEMVAAEEGRMMQNMVHYPVPVPMSPNSTFPDYMSVEEALPAYDEGSDDSSYVADGLRYTPGSNSYTPSDSSVAGSLDEVLGRKD